MIDVRPRLVATLVALMAAITLASGAGITGYLNDFDAAVVMRRAELAALPGNAKAIAALDKVKSFVEAPSAASTYAAEVAAAAKAAKLLLKKLPAEVVVVQPLTPAGNKYRTEILAARNEFFSNTQSLTGAAGKKAKKTLAKADKALAKSDAAPNPGVRLANLATAAKLLAVQPDDHIPDGHVNPRNAAVDATGHFLYVSMYGNNLGTFGGHVRQFRIAQDGTLSNLSPPVVAAGTNVTSVAAHPTLPVVYATSQVDRKLYVFAAAADGTLSPAATPSVDLAAIDTLHVGFATTPLMVVPSVEGDLLFVLENYVGGCPVMTFDLNTDGSVGSYKDWEAGTPLTYTLAVPRRDPITHELRVYTASPYDNALYHNEIRTFDVTPAGLVTSLNSTRVRATAMTVGGSGTYVYAAEQYSPTGIGFAPGVIILPRLPIYPYLDEYETPLQLTGAMPSSIVLNAGENHLYMSSTDGLAIRQFDTAAFAAAPMSAASVTAPPVASLTLSRDGKFLFAVRSDAEGVAPSGIVTVYAVDAATGALTKK